MKLMLLWTKDIHWQSAGTIISLRTTCLKYGVHRDVNSSLIGNNVCETNLQQNHGLTGRETFWNLEERRGKRAAGKSAVLARKSCAQPAESLN